MKIFILLLSVITIFSCSTVKENKKYKEDLSVDNYRRRSMCLCLLYAYDSTGQSNVRRLGYSDQVAFAIFDSSILSELRPVFNKMIKDSIDKIGRVAENASKIDIFNNCLDYYNSKQLKKSARKNLKRIRQSVNIDTAMYYHVHF
jgi:hypothetical protein